ncbi:MAG: DUF1559 domain-containing protein [Planctomycetota bacterium]
MKRLAAAKSLPAVLAAALVLPTLTGCGGTSKDDIRRMMANKRIDRGEPDEEDEAPAPKPPTPPTANATPVTATATATPDDPAADNRSIGPPPEPAERPSAAVSNGPRDVSSDPVERASIAAENITRISRALMEHLEEKGRLPPRCTLDKERTPLLSWRVVLLPKLGYDDLYQEFRLDEPWNTPHNLRVMEQMPDVYRSPERTDNKTCVLAINDRSSAMGQRRPLGPTAFEDGARDTLLILEAPPERAVEWTRPDDFDVEPRAPLAGLGSHRGGLVFVGWADGSAGSIPSSTSARQFLAATTFEGGEPFRQYQINSPIDPSAVLAGGGAPAGGGGLAGPAGATATSGGTAPTGPLGGSAVASSPTGLAQQYLEAATAAKSQGFATDAWHWLAGAVCVGAPPSSWVGEYNWATGLRRPVLGLHFGVGLVGAFDRPANDRRPAEKPTREELLDETEPVGTPLLEMIEQHAAKTAPSAIAGDAKAPSQQNRRRSRYDVGPPVTFLEPARGEGELIRRGAALGCDVVVAVKVETRSDGQKYITVELHDPVRREKLATSGRILSPLEEDKADFLRDKQYQAASWRIKDFLEDELTPGPWPVTLRPSQAAGRMTSLSRSRTAWPLTALIEMRYYRSQGLVDDAQLLRAMTGLLGDDATPLLLGSDTKKRRVLRQWLPSDDPAAILAAAERRRAREEDEDD